MLKPFEDKMTKTRRSGSRALFVAVSLIACGGSTPAQAPELIPRHPDGARIGDVLEPLRDTHDGLRRFEIKDADGYLLFFGRPQ